MNIKTDLILCAFDLVGFILSVFTGKDAAFWAIMFAIHGLFYKVDTKK